MYLGNSCSILLSYGTGYDLSKSFSDFDSEFPYSPLIKSIARRKKTDFPSS